MGWGPVGGGGWGGGGGLLQGSGGIPQGAMEEE